MISSHASIYFLFKSDLIKQRNNLSESWRRMMTAHPANPSALLTFSHSVAKISQFTTQWKGNRVIALKQQISTSELNVELTVPILTHEAYSVIEPCQSFLICLILHIKVAMLLFFKHHYWILWQRFDSVKVQRFHHKGLKLVFRTQNMNIQCITNTL